jgi:hypothetical protein
MLAPQIRLNVSHKSDFAAVCELGAETLAKIADRVEAGFTIRRSQIELTIQEVIEPEQSAILGRVLFGIASTFRRFSLTPDDALERITKSLGEVLQEDARFAKWAECRPALKRLLDTRSIFLAAKALDISYDFERLYLAGRLLTSVRPVFDPPREEIVGATIVQTLRLEFVAPNGDQSSISVAMDKEDIRKLKDECERAIDKADRAQVRFEKDCQFEAIIPGEETNE